MHDSQQAAPSRSDEIRKIIHTTKILIGDIEQFLNTKKTIKGTDSQ